MNKELVASERFDWMVVGVYKRKSRDVTRLEVIDRLLAAAQCDVETKLREKLKKIASVVVQTFLQLVRNFSSCFEHCKTSNSHVYLLGFTVNWLNVKVSGFGVRPMRLPKNVESLLSTCVVCLRPYRHCDWLFDL